MPQSGADAARNVARRVKLALNLVAAQQLATTTALKNGRVQSVGGSPPGQIGASHAHLCIHTDISADAPNHITRVQGFFTEIRSFGRKRAASVTWCAFPFVPASPAHAPHRALSA